MELLSSILPDGPPLHLETWQMDPATAQVTLMDIQALAWPRCTCTLWLGIRGGQPHQRNTPLRSVPISA
jgi:hypothetical protein